MQTEHGFVIEVDGQKYVLPELSGKSHELGRLQLSHSLRESELLAILNDHARYPNGPTPGGKRRILRTIIPSPQSLKEIAPEERAGVQLRRLVDQWIDSARNKDGSEMPARRRLIPGREAMKESRMAVWIYSESLRLLFDHDGTLTLSGESPRLPYTTISSGYLPAAPPSELTHGESARAYFVSLLLSPRLAHRIAKCRVEDCGTYFFLKQTQRTRTTLCQSHADEKESKQASQTKKATRKAARDMLYSRIANRYGDPLQDTGWERNALLVGRVVAFANREIDGNAVMRAAYGTKQNIGITAAWLRRRKNIAGITTAIHKAKRVGNAAR